MHVQRTKMTDHPGLLLEILYRDLETTGEEEEQLVNNEGAKVALILPRITAVVSLLAVVCVFLESWNALRTARNQGNGVTNTACRIRSNTAARNINTVQYIQFFYQIPLFCFSLACALGTLPAPAEQGIWGAAGTTATCTAQGILMQFGVLGTLCWDACLSFTYLAMAKSWNVHGWKSRYHLVAWPVVLTTSLIPLFKDMYNFNYNACWIHEYPDDCEGDECIRGEGAQLWTGLISFAGVLHVAYSIVVMVCLYCLIRRIENQASASQPSSSLSEGSNRQYSRAVLIQGILYAGGMLLTTLPTGVNVLVYDVTGHFNHALGAVALTMTPLVGYVNFIIYMRNLKPEDCHTKYARLLRRAHSWFFDYNIPCKCRCACLPRFRDSSEEDATDPTVKQRKEKQRDDSAWQLVSKDTTVGPLDSPSSSKCTGFMLQLKNGASQRISQLISDLGESSGSDWVDVAPAKPRRLKSETNEPPSLPLRALSEAPECQDLNITDEAETGTQRPPTKPMRIVSGILESLAEEEDQHGDQYAILPSLPSRVSEIELKAIRSSSSRPDASYKSASNSSTPPVKPARCLSEIEALDDSSSDRSPPTKPVRYESEIDPPESEVVGIVTSQAPPKKPVRYASELDAVDLEEAGDKSDQSPPLKPIRCKSEVETLGD